MSNGQPNDNDYQRRKLDKHNIYLPYLRELGAMAILAAVLYGVWDLAKQEGRLFIKAVEQQTAMMENQVKIQTELLDHLKRLEDTQRERYSYTPSTTYGPPSPFPRTPPQ